MRESITSLKKLVVYQSAFSDKHFWMPCLKLYSVSSPPNASTNNKLRESCVASINFFEQTALDAMFKYRVRFPFLRGHTMHSGL